MSGSAVPARIARALMIAGAGVAVLGAAAWTLDLLPAMPEWMVRLAIFKLTVGSGIALIVVGAVMRRGTRDVAASGAVGGTDVAGRELDAGTGAPDLRGGRDRVNSAREER